VDGRPGISGHDSSVPGGGLVASKHAFKPWERILGESWTADESAADSKASGLSDSDYKKIRLAFNAFDLAAGLTKNDFESIPTINTYYFAMLWECVGAIFVLKKPRKKKRD
jgi:hypothetical protein